jgi:hypothetical protein
MLEYAANGQYYWDKEILRKYGEGTASGKLSEGITTLTRDNSQTVDAFLDSLIAKLKVGEIRLIFYGGITVRAPQYCRISQQSNGTR